MSLLDRMLKSGAGNSQAAIMSQSTVFTDRDVTPTKLPILNVALGGELAGGISAGLTILAGVSKTFKSALTLYCMKAYLDKYSDAIGIFYDTEMGITNDYMKQFGIDTDRVVHITVDHVEQLKFDMTKKLEELKRGDHVFFMIDSIGQISSKKEVDDAVDEKSVADMTRAKALRSFFRLVTIQLAKKNLPCIAVNHVYQTQEMFCLAGDTLIRTDSGLKEIKNIDIGDMVYGFRDLKPVTNKFLPEDLPKTGVKYLKLTFDDGSFVRCTNTHKFLMNNDEWVQAGDINIGGEFK
jgi:RecA/RadA recombinase